MALTVVYQSIADLIPYVNNAKQHPDDQVNKIASSIKHFGFNQPLVIDKNNEVIVGHGRLEAAKKLSMEQVPCIRAEGLTEAQIKAYRLADNRTAESAWDWDLVKVELEELQGLDFDVEVTGFDAGEIEGITQEPEIVYDDEAESSNSGGHDPVSSVSFWIFDHKVTDKRDETWQWVQNNLDKIKAKNQEQVATAIMEGLRAILD